MALYSKNREREREIMSSSEEAASKARSRKEREDALFDFMSQWPSLLSAIHSLEKHLQRRSLRGSYEVAKEVGLLFRRVIGMCAFPSVRKAMSAIRILGRKLLAASPHELVIGNVTRRVLKVIRDVMDEKYMTTDDISAENVSLNTLLSYSPRDAGAASKEDEEDDEVRTAFRKIRADIIQLINDDIVDNLEALHDDIMKEAADYIHSGEVILTYGESETVLKFLTAAKRKRDFEVIVAESSRVSAAHKMANHLAAQNVSTTLMANSAVFAMMARVDKVIVGAHCVMANGGLIGDSGLHALSLAAKHHSVPLVCVAGLYKLCPEFPFDQNTVNNLLSPSQVLSFEELGKMSQDGAQIDVLNPAYDYVPPNLVNLFVTNESGSQPSYMYRLLQELYHRDDHVL